MLDLVTHFHQQLQISRQQYHASDTKQSNAPDQHTRRQEAQPQENQSRRFHNYLDDC
jgi:hypothetical protein